MMLRESAMAFRMMRMMTMVRNTEQAIDWYRANEVWPADIGFDPDGMCQKICRTARLIGPGAPSALASQEQTPAKYRVKKVRDVRKGMVMYFDDPNDSNPFGHIVTVVGRVKGGDPDSLDSILVRTNSVKSNSIVVVRASYFKQHWGDDFQFAATWLNGVAFPDFIKEPVKEKPVKGGSNVVHAVEYLQKARDSHKRAARNAKTASTRAKHERLARALARDIQTLNARLRGEVK